MGQQGNTPSCVRGNREEAQSPNIPMARSYPKLVRRGSHLYSKNTFVTKGMRVGFAVGRSESGLRVNSVNEVRGSRERVYDELGVSPRSEKKEL